MQVEQRFTLPVPPAQAWPAFHDIALLVECLPGASLAGELRDGEVPLRFEVRMGPIVAAFTGSGRVGFDEAARSGRFEGAAADRKTNSRVKGAADFALAEAGAGTEVTVRVDYTLSGTLAQFGRIGLVREIANTLTAQFAANLEARLNATLPAAAPATAPAAPPAQHIPREIAPDSPPMWLAAEAVPAGATAASAGRAGALPLSLTALLARVLRERWSRLARRVSPGGRR
ncbi:SRPBCC family protein [Ramlibacter sp.]|uniref:SRPBCC family protein n=1 Tax=Ramlibacter sp. TaxID=1917967 RepID=UPI00263254C7|nr:SRPBCC family protein [Ramlibacter sp.]MDB5956089.1 carbon monoxide dehydrogenase [Ramlibacter sp.]